MCSRGSLPPTARDGNPLTFISRVSRVAILCVISASCTAKYPTEPTKAPPVGLYLAYASPKGRTAPTATTGTNTYSFLAYTIDTDGVYERVSDRAVWSSSDETIVRPATSTPSGLTRSFLAVSPGTASVTARYQGVEATAPVQIVENGILSAVPRIDLTWTGQTSVGSVSVVRALMRTATQNNVDVSGAAQWTSSNPEVATVDSGGVIRAISPGTTIISASANGLVDWFWFSVIPK